MANEIEKVDVGEIPDVKVGNLEDVRKIKAEEFNMIDGNGKTAYEIAVVKDGFFERAIKWSAKTIAGQNTVGKIGHWLKDGLSAIGILPPALNKGSDLVGNLVNRKKNKSDMNWIVERLQERSTWRGMVAAATAVGVLAYGCRSNG